jgi:hypothetical protein
LKPEWWGSPLAQQEKYQGKKPAIIKNYRNNIITTTIIYFNCGTIVGGI